MRSTLSMWLSFIDVGDIPAINGATYVHIQLNQNADHCCPFPQWYFLTNSHFS